MNSVRRIFLLLALAILAACQDGAVVGPTRRDEPEPLFHGSGSMARGVEVLNWNLYLGVDADPVVAALASPDATDDLPALLAAIATLEETHFPTRAAAIADEIERTRPHVVGLQEVWTIVIQFGENGAGVSIDLDYLAILQAELAARGLDYAVAVIGTNIDLAPFPGIHVVDHDVLLVDPSRVSVLSSVARNFVNNLVIPPGLVLKRGWVAIAAEIGGRTYAVVNTHLESGAGAPFSALRAAQASELVAALAGDNGGPPPAIMMGDVDQRIDYVFTRDVGHPRRGVLGRITRLGEQSKDRIPGPEHKIWPSDHAGLAARLVSPPAHGPVASVGR